MVRAILEGRKTQTRRIVKGTRWLSEAIDVLNIEGSPSWTDGTGWDSCVRCPYGAPGDRLWVRETWADMGWPPTGPQYAYRADPDSSDNDAQRWKPSIHMPRSASRITLEVLNVRVERLQDISEEDAKAEGVTLKGMSRYDGEARDAFEALWCGINGAESWDANPWVWVIGFKVIKP